jgi:hypothetical protein
VTSLLHKGSETLSTVCFLWLTGRDCNGSFAAGVGL